MTKRIKVSYTPYGSEVIMGIPVAYEIEENGTREVYKCAVELTGSDIPGWLDITRFDIPKVTMNNVIVTRFSEISGIRSIDTALFIATVDQTISIAEMVQ